MTQDCSEEPAMVDTAPPVNVRIEPAMSVNHLIGASSGAPNDGYAAACALAQVWGDLLLVAEGSGQSLSVRRRARAGAARAARAAFDIARGRVLRTESPRVSRRLFG